MEKLGEHAVVIGASVAGLLAARVLAERYAPAGRSCCASSPCATWPPTTRAPFCGRNASRNRCTSAPSSSRTATRSPWRCWSTCSPSGRRGRRARADPHGGPPQGGARRRRRRRAVRVAARAILRGAQRGRPVPARPRPRRARRRPALARAGDLPRTASRHPLARSTPCASTRAMPSSSALSRARTSAPRRRRSSRRTRSDSRSAPIAGT
jgi:hypothetical protein